MIPFKPTERLRVERTANEQGRRAGRPKIVAVAPSIESEILSLDHPRVGLLERGAIFNELARSLAACKRGALRIVAVTGSPGVGKTAVLEEFSQQASRSRQLVVRGTYRRGSVGAEAFHEAILDLISDPWAEQFDGVKELAERLGARGITGLSRIDRVGDRYAGDLVEVVLALSAQRLVVLVLDDLHWQGDSGWALLERLVRAAAYRVDRGERLHLHICLAFRDGECGDRWARVIAQAPTTEIASLSTLEPLSELAVNQLLRRALTTGIGGDIVAAVVHRSGGNPLYVHQLCRGLRQAQMSHPRSDLALSLVERDLSGVVDLREFATEKMARSSPSIRLAVAAVSLSGTPLPAVEVDAVVGTVTGSTSQVWRDATLRGLIRVRDGLAAPVHGVFGDVAAELLDVEDRALIHAALAQHWFAAGAPPWVVAQHARHASQLFSPEWVAQQCTEAALTGLRLGDYSMAKDFGAHALKHAAGLTPDALMRLHHVVSLASFRSHDPTGAEEAVSAALRYARSCSDADTEARLLSILARARLTFDPLYRDPPELVGFLATAPHLPSSLASRLQEDLAEFAILRNDPAADARVAQCVALAENSEDPLALAPAYFAQGLSRWVALDLPPAIAAFHASSRAAQNGDDPWFEVWGDGRLGLVHLMLGELGAARRAGDRAIALAERVHDWSEHSLAASVLTAATFAGGDLTRAAEIGEVTLALVARSEYIWGARSIFPMLAHIAALQGSADKVEDLLQRWEASGVGVPAAHAAAALCELGQLNEAAARIEGSPRYRRIAGCNGTRPQSITTRTEERAAT